MKQTSKASLSRSTITVPKAIDLETFLAKLSAKDRKSFDRQVLVREQSVYPGLADRWKRLACLLSTLAPSFLKISGADTMQFFIADGKYRKQVFAMHTTAEGTIEVYTPDVLAEAVAAKIVTLREDAPEEEKGTAYRVDGDSTMTIDSLDGKTINQPPFYKDMTGWNRKATCVIIPAIPNEAHVLAAEKICALAATHWENLPQATTATPQGAPAPAAKK